MRVWDAVAAILKREGVEQLCAFPTTPLIDACAAIGIRPVICRQERVGVGIADGFSRTTGGKRVGVFAMQSGPGAENAYPGVATAYADSSPILVIPTGLPRERAQVFPDYDTRMGYASISKNFERLTTPDMTVEVMRRAFGLLRTARSGPVVVEIPTDVGTEAVGDVDAYRPVPSAIAAGNPSDIDTAAEALVGARRPVIYAGQGILYAEASDGLRELAEMLDIPVATSLGGKSAFPENHPLALGTVSLTMNDAAVQFFKAADLIFAIGCSLTKHALLTAKLPAAPTLIHSTNDGRDINKSYRADHPILGDARLVLAQLLEAVRVRLGKEAPRVTTNRQDIATARAKWLDAWLPKLTSNEVPLSAYRIVWEFMRTINPDEAIVTHDAGSPRDQLVPFYVATRPHGYIGWGKSHQLGTGLGLILGAKLAEPGKLCVNWMGDAAFGMTGLDLETAVRSDLPILTMVLKNSTMAVEKSSLTVSHERYRSRDLGGEYWEIARALGTYAERVQAPDEIAPAIERARRQTEQGRPSLLEFITSSDVAFSNYRGLG